MRFYKNLSKQIFSKGEYSLVPIRIIDMYNIMQWRNEQIYHLRQDKPLTQKDQDCYFKTVISNLFEQDQPDQILFSYLKDEKCIGYGGLVHINWSNQNAEISFLMETALEKDYFNFHWTTYLELIEIVAFEGLKLHKIFTYAYDLRPNLFIILEKNGYYKEATLYDHCYFDNMFKNVIIHAKRNAIIRKANLLDAKLTYQWANDPKVRNYSFNKQKIDWSSHLKWFKEKLLMNECLYYILFNETHIIGSIRFDIEGETAKISYLIDSYFQGKGWGIQLLKMGIDMAKKETNLINRFEGLVMNNNIASIKIFEKMGFKKFEDDSTKSKYYLSIS
ncbi:MAG: GNAT family N-acetyltransferase [Bacteroidales bacterium]